MKPNVASIYFRSISILVVSCGFLALVVSYLGDRASRDIAVGGVERLARIQTSLTSDRLFGPMRFRKNEDVAAILNSAVAATDLLNWIAAFDRNGNLVAEAGAEAAETTDFVELAVSAAESGIPMVSADGLTAAYPVRKSPEGDAAGAVVSRWTTQPLQRVIEEQHRMQLLGAGLTLLVLIVVSALVTRHLVSAPIERIRRCAEALTRKELDGVTPDMNNRSEVGDLAKAMESLRNALRDAEEDRQTAFIRSSGFMSSSSASLMADRELNVTFANRSCISLLGEMASYFQGLDPEFKPDDMIGRKADLFLPQQKDTLDNLHSDEFPLAYDVQADDSVLNFHIVALEDGSGARSGYVFELADVTEIRKTAAILSALETGQMRADFNSDGKLVSANDRFSDIVGTNAPQLMTLVAREDQAGLWNDLKAGKAHFGRYTLALPGQTRIVNGSVSPVHGSDGSVSGFVLMGDDVTDETSRLNDANERNARMAETQQRVALSLQKAMSALSGGDLRHRIAEGFADEHEALRDDFNSAVSTLDSAVGKFVESAKVIQCEAESISGSTDAFSERTEQQAVTLKETAAAIAQLAASVDLAAQRARDANDIVSSAQQAADSSGSIVKETVSAMDEIAQSSEQISRIIGVIDEIAFQTNLLALNAGVEAARAGDAGRGFAVVASELRALAQRSSEAAREISDLISASREHVKKGVSLVDKAGEALTGIADTIGTVAEHVSDISKSAHEQATGVGEINQAMDELDRATQENVSMFDKTIASTASLNAQAISLVEITGEFRCTTARTATRSRSAMPNQLQNKSDDSANERNEAPVSAAELSPAVAGLRPKNVVAAEGNLATQTIDDEDDWEEF